MKITSILLLVHWELNGKIVNRYGKCDSGKLILIQTQSQIANPWYHHPGLLFYATCPCQNMQKLPHKISKSMQNYEMCSTSCATTPPLSKHIAFMMPKLNNSLNRSSGIDYR